MLFGHLYSVLKYVDTTLVRISQPPSAYSKILGEGLCAYYYPLRKI